MRIDPIIAGPAVSVLIAGVIGVGAMTGLLPSGLSPKQGDARPADPGSQSVPGTSCGLCGTVESIRTIEGRNEPREVGTVAGGVSGAAAGKPADSGNAHTPLTILRAVAGAITREQTQRDMEKTYSHP